MKRLLKILLVAIVSFSLVGCGGGTASTEEQEKVITDYFGYIKKGEVEKANKLGTDDYEDFLGDDMGSFEEYLDEETYGEVFVGEAQKFMDSVFESLIKEYKIKNIKVDGDKTALTVTGKRLDLETINTDDLTDETEELVTQYQTDNLEDLKDLYLKEGEDAMMEKIFGDISKELFGLLIEKVEEADYIDFTLSFELVKEKDKWLINEVKETTASTSKDKDSNKKDKDSSKKDEDSSKKDEDDLDSILDDKTYKVDESKLQADATLLKKGRLAGDDYGSKKYVDTDLEFIDYNVTNGTSEIDKYDMIDTTSGTLKFETEIHGDKGSTVVIVISDDRQTIATDTYTLTDTKQVFTKEMTGLDANAKYFSVRIYVGDTYDTKYEYGDDVGNYLISKDS